MFGSRIRNRHWYLRCPECGEEWVTKVHRDEMYGWEVEQEYCPVCDAAGNVIDDEVDQYEAADARYDQLMEEEFERLFENNDY